MATDWFAQPNITNYTGMVTYANEVTNNVFGASLPWLVFIVAFMTLSGYGYKTERSVLVSGYLAWVLSILMRVLGWVPDYIVVVFSILVAVTVFLSYKERGVG
jgi:hypothetical protein